MIINLVDFPLNQEELQEFVKLRNPINKFVVVQEKKPRNFEKMLKEYHKELKKRETAAEDQKQPEADGEAKELVELIENEDRDRTLKMLNALDYKCFKASFGSVLKLCDASIIRYEHKTPQAENADANQKSSIEDLKVKILNQIKSSEESLIRYCNEQMKRRKKPRPDTGKKSEKGQDEVKDNDSGPDADPDKPKPPVELIPAGYQEEVLKVLIEEDNEKFGEYDESKSRTK